MLVAALGDQVLTKDDSLQDGVDLVWSHPQVRAELAQLLVELDDRVDHLHGDARPIIPMSRCRCMPVTRASRSWRRLASGTGAKVPPWRTGVYEAKSANAELLAFTLDKSSGAFSPTTRYRDYAISPTLHPLGEPVDDPGRSDTGLRYRNHERDGRSIMLFARLARRRPRLLVPRPRHLSRPRR